MHERPPSALLKVFLLAIVAGIAWGGTGLGLRIAQTTSKIDSLVQKLENTPADSQHQSIDYSDQLKDLQNRVQKNIKKQDPALLQDQIREMKVLISKREADNQSSESRLSKHELLNALTEQKKLDLSAMSSLWQFIGSVLIVVTAYNAIKNLEVARKNLSLSERKQTSELIAKATDQLGDEKLIVRTGGANTLILCVSSIDGADGNSTINAIVNTLAAFVVESLRNRKKSRFQNTPGSDVSSAFDFLATMPLKQEKINLKHSDFTNILMDKRNFCCLDLSHSKFCGASLNNAVFDGSIANDSDFRQAEFSNLKLFNSFFDDCDFGKSPLCSWDSIEWCSFSRAKFGPGFVFDVNRTIFHANFSLSDHVRSIFDKATIIDSSFQGARVKSSSMKSATLRNVDFSYANLKGCNFSEAIFDNCIFDAADLEGAIFEDADLSGQDLSNARNLTIKQVLDMRGINGIKLSLSISIERRDIRAVELSGVARISLRSYLWIQKKLDDALE